MTLIVGLNLSDRIYIAADTRATVDTPQGRKRYDDLMKSAPIPPPPNPDNTFGLPINFTAVSGFQPLARFFYLCINKRIQEKKINYDIRSLYNALDESWCEEMCKYWFKSSKLLNGIGCSLIIGGTSSTNTKPYKKTTLQELVTFHQEIIAERPVETYPGLPHIVNMNKVTTMIPDHLNSFYMDNQIQEIQLPDTFIFSLDIDINWNTEKGFIFNKDEAEKGELLSRGAVNLSDLEKKSLIADCELMYSRNDSNLAHEIAELIRSYFSKNVSIGGPITIQLLAKDTSRHFYDIHEIRVTGDKVEFKDEKGGWHERNSFTARAIDRVIF